MNDVVLQLNEDRNRLFNVLKIMKGSPEVPKGTTKLPKQVDQQPESETVSANMTLSNPPIQQDVIDYRDGSPNTTPSIESPSKGTKRKSRMDVSSPSVDSSTINDSVVESDTNSAVEKSTGRWTIQEHEAFVRGLSLYGREWKRVAQIIPTRTAAQVRSHAQKYFQHLEQGQQRQLLQQQDPMIHQKLRQNDAFDFNYDGWAHDANQVPPNLDLTVSSNQTGNREGSTSDTSMILNTMSDSVREQAARIMANPTSVHHEVNVTLHQLRQRYRELQSRFAQIQRQNNNSSTVTPSDSTSSETNHHPTSIVSSPNRHLDEQIVVQVLQARLQQHNRISIPASVPEYGTTNVGYTGAHDQELNSSTLNRAEEHPSDYDGDVETDNDEMNI